MVAAAATAILILYLLHGYGIIKTTKQEHGTPILSFCHLPRRRQRTPVQPQSRSKKSYFVPSLMEK